MRAERSGKRGVYPLLIVCAVGALIVAGMVGLSVYRESQPKSKGYTRDEFTAAVSGKTEQQVRQQFGAPHLEEIEPQGSKMSGKRVYGYAYARTSPPWVINGEANGGVYVYFSQETGKIDYVQFEKPPQNGGGFIFIRF